MTRIFQTGFEMGSTDVLAAVNSASVSTSQVRPPSSVYSFNRTLSGAYGACAIPATTEFYTRAGFYLSLPDGGHLYDYASASGVQCHLTVNSQNYLVAYKAGNEPDTNILGTSSSPLALGRWQLVETHIKIHATAGTIEVKVDGVSILSLTNVVTQNQTETTVVTFYLGSSVSGQSNASGYDDDIAVNDTAGTVNNSWVGDGQLVGLVPNAAGDFTQFSVSAGSNYAAVDEKPPNDDTDYVFDSVSGHKDLYNITDLGSSLSGVNAATLWARVKKTDAGAVQFNHLIKSGGTENTGAATTPSTAYAYYGKLYDTNPVSAAAWTVSDINALQVGAKIV